MENPTPLQSMLINRRFPTMPRDRSQLAPAALRVLGSLVVALMILATSCSARGTAPTTESAESPVTQPSPLQTEGSTVLSSQRGQQLPITARTVLGGQEIFLEVAVTPEQQSLGLMYRDPLPDDRGMLFPMGRPRPVTFWMKNVPVPLDMVFIYQGSIQAIAAEVPPCAADPCPVYGPGSQPIDQVLELRAGRAAELGLSVGDRVEIEPVAPKALD